MGNIARRACNVHIRTPIINTDNARICPWFACPWKRETSILKILAFSPYELHARKSSMLVQHQWHCVPAAAGLWPLPHKKNSHPSSVAKLPKNRISQIYLLRTYCWTELLEWHSKNARHRTCVLWKRSLLKWHSKKSTAEHRVFARIAVAERRPQSLESNFVKDVSKFLISTFNWNSSCRDFFPFV